MKLYKYILAILILPLVLISCDKWNEAHEKDMDDEREEIVQTEEYYHNLREFKKNNKEITFGWFGGWTGEGASRVTHLMSAPDSVDLISIWGNGWQRSRMTTEKYIDMSKVRDIKGTKVLVTSLLGWVGKEFPHLPKEHWAEGEEGLRQYARELAEEIIDLGFNGFDIDYEPYSGGIQDVRECPVGDDMVAFVEELGKYFGPQSGTNRILAIDGELNVVPAECAHYFNYAIAQAYGSRDDWSLDGRYSAISSMFEKKQFIVTENFESHWRNGGVKYTLTDGTIVPSLIGMAKWSLGEKGGVGTYHMEYEYGNKSMQYEYLRKAIQIMNPAKK